MTLRACLTAGRKRLARHLPGKRQATILSASLSCALLCLLLVVFDANSASRARLLHRNSEREWPVTLCPWLSNEHNSTTASHVLSSAKILSKRTLVVYGVLNSSPRSVTAFRYFTELGIQDQAADFVFVFVDSFTRKVALRSVPSTCVSYSCSTLTGLQSASEDWIGHVGLSTLSTRIYEYYLFVSTNEGGPFLPKYISSRSWTQALSSQLTIGGAKMLVPTLFCLDTSRALTVSSRSYIMIDSDVFKFGASSGLFSGGMHVNDLPSILVQRGFSFRVLDPAVSITMWLKTRNDACEPNPSALHPYDVMFSSHYPTQLLHAPRGPVLPAWPAIVPDTLIVYVYFEKDQECIDNLLYFLRTGVSQHARVSYLFLVNGNSSVQFPSFPNVEVVFRENTCLDIGTWGQFVKRRAGDFLYFIVMNTSLRGPFLPFYWNPDLHWSVAFTQFLDERTKLVGLSINCPDGAGRKYINVQSMILAFDRSTINLWNSFHILDFAPDVTAAYRQESDLTRVLLENGHGVEVMQRLLHVSNWSAYHSVHKSAKIPRSGGYDFCEDVDLDIFFKPNWYGDSMPYGTEFIFLKTNRLIFDDLPVFPKLLPPFESPPNIVRSFLLFSHYLQPDGAPIYLFDLAELLLSLGYDVQVASPADGPLRTTYEAAGISVHVFPMSVPWASLQADTCAEWIRTVLQTLFKTGFSPPDVLLFNTVLWLPFIRYRHQLHLSANVIWAIHEAELDVENEQGGFSYSSLFPDMHDTHVWASADLVLFSASSVRSAVSRHDRGNFETFYFYGSNSSHLAQVSKHEARRAMNIPNGAVVVSTVGTVTRRKRQEWTVRAFLSYKMANPKVVARLLLIGWPLQEDEYAKYVHSLIPTSLSRSIILVRQSDRISTLQAVATADLHVSASSHESFPLNTLEAMMLGVPVLATPAYGVVEQIVSDDLGFLVPAYDNYTAFSDMFSMALQDVPRLRRIGYSSQSFFNHSFSREQAASKVAGFLKRLPIADNRPTDSHKVCLVLVVPGDFQQQQIHSLERAMASIVNQSFSDWKLIISSWTRVHFAVHRQIALFNDHRIAFSGHNSASSIARMTDQSIRNCAADTKWLLITNFDSVYHPSFLRGLFSGGTNKDILSDSLSHQRMESTVLNFHRFHCEGHRFSQDAGDVSPSEMLFRLVERWGP